MAPSKRSTPPTAHTARQKKPRAAAAAMDPRLQLISDAFRKVDTFPPEIRAMVNVLLPHSLGVAHGERATCQHKVVEMIGAALVEIEGAILESIAAADREVSTVDAEKEALLAAKSEAESALEAKEELVSEKQREFDGSAAALLSAEGSLEEAKSAQKAGNAELDRAEARLEKLKAAHANSFLPAKEGSIEAGAVQMHSDVFVSIGKDLKLDESLLIAIPKVLAKEPPARGNFDDTVLSQFGEALTAGITSLGAALAEGEGAKAERAKAVESAEELRSEANQKKQACEEALGAAKAELRHGEAAVAAAALALAGHGPRASGAAKAAADARAQLESFRGATLATFRELERPAAVEPQGEAGAPVLEAAQAEAAAAAEEEPAA